MMRKIYNASLVIGLLVYSLFLKAQTYNFNQTFSMTAMTLAICENATYSDLDLEVCDDHGGFGMPTATTTGGYLAISGAGIGNSAGVDKPVTFSKSDNSNFNAVSVIVKPVCYRPYSSSPYETTDLKFEAFQGSTKVGSYSINGAQHQVAYTVNFSSVPGFTSTGLTSIVVHTGVQSLQIDQLVLSSTSSNSAPTASSVSFSGTLEMGQTLTGNYTYTDADTDPESGTTYKWYRADDNSGTNKAAISGATAQTYTLQSADAGKYISFEVTPNDGTDAGAAVESSLQGGVLCGYPSGSSMYTEDFEAIPVSGTSFTHSATNITFYTTDSLGVSTISNAGINSSDRFLDNLGRCLPGPGKVGSVTTNGVADFYVHDFWLFPSENCYTVGTNGTIIIRGKKSGSTIFTHTVQSSDLNSNGGVDKGFTFIDMANYECYAIDELEFEVTGSLDYIAIDDFKFTAVPQSTGVLLSTGPTLTFSNNTGLSDSKATDGEGGSVTITDIDIEAFPINSSGTALTVDPLEYHDNNDWPGYQAIITYGGTLKHYGWAVKSANGDNFSLQGLDFMDWGSWNGATFQIEAFDNGSSLGTVSFAGNTTSSYVDLDLGGKLTAAFGNVDEIRFYLQSGADSWTALNNIHVSSPVSSPLSVLAVIDSNASCNGFVDGGATATGSGGAAPYNYSWSNSAATASINGVGAGSYIVTVTDSLGATATDTVTITEPAALVAGAVADSNVSCNGQANGGATGYATGGTQPYTYTWSNSATTASINGVSSGTYIVTVTDANGCSDTASVTITEPAVLSASVIIDSNASCNGAHDAGLTAMVSGGTAPYTYSWNNSATTASITGVGAAKYTVTITDANGCSDTASVTITEPTALVASAIVDSNVSCNGQAIGGATGYATGGTQPYTYTWSNTATTASIQGVQAGTYVVQITDANGCTDTASVVITEPATLVATAYRDSNASCNGSADGGATVSAMGGTAPYTYLWSNTATTASIAGVSAGTYTVTVTDAKGCFDTASVVVYEPAALVAMAVVDSNVSCNGQFDGGATAAAAGGTPPYTYGWSNSATTASVNGVGAGKLIVTITDANGCSDTASVTVTQPASLSAHVSVDSNVSCNGAHDGGLTASATGGTPPYTYTWTNGAATASTLGLYAGTYSVIIADANGCIDTASGTIVEPTVLSASSATTDVSCNGGTDGAIDITVTGGTAPYTFDWGGGATTEDRTGLSAGNYPVTITDANGCSTTVNSTVGEPDMLLSKDTTVASGSVTINGNWGGWLDDATGVVEGNPTIFAFAGFTSGTDHVGWNKFDISSIPDNATITSVTLELYCNRANGGSTVSIDINDIMGVYGPYGSINPSAYTDFNNGTYTSVDVTSAGYYSNIDLGPQAAADLQSKLAGDEFQIALDANGNTDWKRFTSNINNITVVYGVSSGKVEELCYAGIPSAFNNLDSISGGVGPFTYEWQQSADYGTSWATAPGKNDSIAYVPSMPLMDTTFYRRMVIDQSCGDSAFSNVIEVHVPDSLQLDSAITNVSCNGGSDGAIDLTVVGGAAPFTYAWSNTATTEDMTGLSAGTYTVTVTDDFGCTVSKSFTVNEPAVLVASAVVDSNVTCNGLADGGATAMATGGTMPYSYSWTNGDATSHGDSMVAGTYIVTITDANGCSDTASVSITEPALLVANVALDSNESCTGANDGGLSASATGGTLPYSYAWSNGASTATITGIAAGNYTVTITDANGCTATDHHTVIMEDLTNPTVIVQNINAYLDATGNVTITAARVDNGSNDFCGLDTLILNNYSFNCSDLGTNTVWFKAIDINGNMDSATATVTVIDTVAPMVVTSGVTVYLNAAGQASIVDADIENGSTDACGVASTSLNQYNFDCSHAGSNTVYLSVTDVNGNTNSAAANVTVLDTISPVAKVKSLTVYLDQSGQVNVPASALDNGSSDNCTYTLSLSQNLFDCTETGLNLETFTITDASGNSASKDVLITVKDTVRPTLHLRNKLTVSLDQFGNASISASQLDSASTDNCSNLLFFTVSKTNFNCSNLGNNTVMVTAFDNKSNSTSAMATVEVVDYLAPVVSTQNVMAYLNASGQVSVTAADVNNNTADNCSVDSLWLDKSTFDCTEMGQNVVKLYAKDQSGNTAVGSAVITVVDTVSPVVATTNMTVYLDASGSASITPAMVNGGSTDNCAVQSLSLDQSTFSCADLGTNTVMLTATDANSNSGSAAATVTVMDTISPSVVTQNITVALDASGNASITAADVNGGSADACGIQSMSIDVNSFSCADMGANTVTLTVTDNHSNVSSKTATVTVVDNTKPVVATQNITIYLDANGDANITPADINNGSTDNCGITGYSLDISVFDCADLGQNLVVLTATDASNNSATKSAFVTVLDTIDPSIDNLPATLTVYATANQCAANVQWPAITGSDNCNMAAITTSKANGSLFQLGTTPVSVTATDGSGNFITQSFDVIVLDTVAPAISAVPSTFTITPNATSCDAIVNWIEPVALDNCGGVTWTKSHTPGSVLPLGTTTVIYTATDSDNNSSSVSFTIVVTDQLAPVISNVPANITVSADKGQCGANVSFTAPTVTDNCASSVTTVASHTSGSTFPVGTTTVTYTATDGANNVTMASFTITVEDKQAPVVTSVPQSDTVGACGATYTFALPQASDNCSAVNVVQTGGLPSGSIFPAGVTVNTFKVSDANGNDTTVSFTLVVVPQGMPNLPSLLEICENMPSVELTLGQNMVWTGNGIVANGTTFDPATAGAGRHKLEYAFTDAMGCVATGSIYVTVTPQPTKPVITKIGSTTLSTGNYITYQWYRDGVAIPGATSQNYNYSQGGNYQVMVGNSSGCSNFSDGEVIGQGKGGIGLDENLFGSLELYPNPSEGLVNIDLNTNQHELLTISVFNTAGKKVYEASEQTSGEGQVKLDLSHLPDATYMVHIQSGAEMIVKRVVLY